MLDVQDVSAARYRLTPLLQRLTYRLAPIVAVVSDDTSRHLNEEVLGRGKIRSVGRRTTATTFVLPNPIDAERVQALAQSRQPSAKRFRFCSVGRLATQKGHDLLLHSLSIAAPRLGDWECIIVGEGVHRKDLEYLSDKYGLSDAITFLGHQDNPYPLISNSDAFVHTARYEPFGVVLLEALALGCPIVAFACPGAPNEILGDGEFGLTVPAENTDALADALVRIRWETDLRDRLRSLGLARAQDYAPKVIAQRALTLVALTTT